MLPYGNPARKVDRIFLICYNLITVGNQRCLNLAKSKELIYKGHPLRRMDNLIYFGSMADKYIVMLQILDSRKEQDMDVATRVSVQLQLTDAEIKSRDRVIKRSEKDSLYAAMDVGQIWLERALAGKL